MRNGSCVIAYQLCVMSFVCGPLNVFFFVVFLFICFFFFMFFTSTFFSLQFFVCMFFFFSMFFVLPRSSSEPWLLLLFLIDNFYETCYIELFIPCIQPAYQRHHFRFDLEGAPLIPPLFLLKNLRNQWSFGSRIILATTNSRLKKCKKRVTQKNLFKSY